MKAKSTLGSRLVKAALAGAFPAQARRVARNQWEKGHGPRPKRGIDKAGALGRVEAKHSLATRQYGVETPRRPVRLPAGFIEPCNPTFSTKARRGWPCVPTKRNSNTRNKDHASKSRKYGRTLGLNRCKTGFEFAVNS
jgi:hypothetical protein